MMYVDGFVVPVPADRIEDYRAHATAALDVWMEHGALSAVEAMADDVPGGVQTSFPMAVKLEPGEIVIFSFITYRDRAHRDAVNERVFADPRMAAYRTEEGSANWPFDGRRMIWGGFKALVVR
ncbi:MAG: DUF1428 domain-containing protein [Paracoccaceae bacterium]